MRGYQGTRETYDGNIKIIFAKYELNEKANATIKYYSVGNEAKEINGRRQRVHGGNFNKIIL